ncbi:MAG TPA: hypothetical protein PLP50_13255, partial [Thermoanaerobaculia bacterium]|nr:hypothetical protein [Thermoanaerobaculia bacterium]HQN09166.1 hypothetical protein [Thermoanaerobaculia bacterium]HQP87670.1 hypothetical protein [Thermoanaerobaculia bacterium]
MKVRNRATPFQAQSRDRTRGSLRSIVVWYFREVYGRFEGPGVLPFYCDPERRDRKFDLSPSARLTPEAG